MKYAVPADFQWQRWEESHSLALAWPPQLRPCCVIKSAIFQ